MRCSEMHRSGDDVFEDCYTGRTLFIGQSCQCCVVYKAMSDTSLFAS